jgi:hypothetical protein
MVGRHAHIVGGDGLLQELADYLFHLLQDFVPEQIGTWESSRNPVRLAGLERFSHLWDWDHIPPQWPKNRDGGFSLKIAPDGIGDLSMTLAMTIPVLEGIIAMTRGDRPIVIDHVNKKV